MGSAMSTIEQIPACPIGRTKHQAAGKDGEATGHPLCHKHYERLGKMLREIETEAKSLSATPSIAVRWNTGGGGHSGGGAPAFEQAAALLAPLVLTATTQGTGASEDGDERHAGGRIEPIMVVLSEYVDRVRSERGFNPPTLTYIDCTDRLVGTPPHGPSYGLPCLHPSCRGIVWENKVPIPPTINAQRVFLTRQLDWMVHWPNIDVVFSRLSRLLGNIKRANGTAPHPVGQCPVDKDDNTRCGGPLWPVKPTHTAGEQAWTGSSPSAVRCDACGTKWQGPAELARLALILEAQRKAKVAS
jgi:hypothetical protein